jgi:hypothetical protein
MTEAKVQGAAFHCAAGSQPGAESSGRSDSGSEAGIWTWSPALCIGPLVLWPLLLDLCSDDFAQLHDIPLEPRCGFVGGVCRHAALGGDEIWNALGGGLARVHVVFSF